MNVFVSSCSITGDDAASLIRVLRTSGHQVEHSPRTDDPNAFRDWYEKGLPRAVENCDVAIIVIDSVWDSSTWMASEADEIHKCLRAGRIRAALVFNPSRAVVRAAGVLPYVRDLQEIDTRTVVALLQQIDSRQTR